MRVQRVNILDEEVIQIYLSENEAKDENINLEINEIRHYNKNVVIFVSGNEDIATTLQYIINKQALKIAWEKERNNSCEVNKNSNLRQVK